MPYGEGGSVLLGIINGLRQRKLDKMTQAKAEVDRLRAEAYMKQALAQTSAAETANKRLAFDANRQPAEDLIDKINALARLFGSTSAKLGDFNPSVIGGVVSNPNAITAPLQKSLDTSEINKTKLNVAKTNAYGKKVEAKSKMELENKKYNHSSKLKRQAHIYKIIENMLKPTGSSTSKGGSAPYKEFNKKVSSVIGTILSETSGNMKGEITDEQAKRIQASIRAYGATYNVPSDKVEGIITKIISAYKSKKNNWNSTGLKINALDEAFRSAKPKGSK